MKAEKERKHYIVGRALKKELTHTWEKFGQTIRRSNVYPQKKKDQQLTYHTSSFFK